MSLRKVKPLAQGHTASDGWSPLGTWLLLLWAPQVPRETSWEPNSLRPRGKSQIVPWASEQMSYHLQRFPSEWVRGQQEGQNLPGFCKCVCWGRLFPYWRVRRYVSVLGEPRMGLEESHQGPKEDCKCVCKMWPLVFKSRSASCNFKVSNCAGGTISP